MATCAAALLQAGNGSANFTPSTGPMNIKCYILLADAVGSNRMTSNMCYVNCKIDISVFLAHILMQL